MEAEACTKKVQESAFFSYETKVDFLKQDTVESETLKHCQEQNS